MGAFILFLHQDVVFSSSSATAPQIEAVLQSIPIVAARAARTSTGLLDNGGFVGSARITRRTGTFQRITDVAWLYSWPTRATAAAEASAAREIADAVRAQVNLAIERRFGQAAPIFGDPPPDSVLRGGWSLAETLPYDPATNGSEQWWQSGEASRTNTRDAFDLNEQTGSNASVDNPVGPTTNHAPNLDPGGTNDPNSLLNKVLGLVPWAVGGLAIFYIGGPIVQAVFGGARKNPETIRQHGWPGPAIPPASVRRVWKAVEDASPKDRSKVAHAFSRNRLLAALSWNDQDGEYDRLDQDTLADAIVYSVNEAGGSSDIGSRR